MKLHMSKEWFIRRAHEEEGLEIGAGFESGSFRDASVFVDLLRTTVSAPHDPESDKDNPNIYNYETDEES